MTDITVFYVADFKVDLSRSVIIKQQQSTAVEPKVLKVLLLLAQHQGEVVSHDKIMQEVWQGTEVVPNALQRSIAILRKALEDDAKSQTMIATHPRIGYRLVAEVDWYSHQQPAEINKSQSSGEKTSSTFVAKLVLTGVFALLAIWVSAQFLWKPQPKHYTQIQQLTQTDAHESHAIFSPNADYIVYSRYAGSCKSHLYAMKQTGGPPIRLTAEPGEYGVASFTRDGRELVFAAKKQCEFMPNPVPSQGVQECWNIATLDFSLALSQPQQPVYRHQCQAEKLLTPKALPDHQYAFLQQNDGRYQLMHYNDLSKQLTPLFRSDNQFIYHFDVHPGSGRFAVISRDPEHNNRIAILDSEGQVISSHVIQLLPGMSRNLSFYGDFTPDGQHLLALSNYQLYRIGLSGEVRRINTPESNLISVHKHASREGLLAIVGHKDIDVSLVDIDDLSSTPVTIDLNQRVLPFASLARSTAREHLARFQPGGEHIAFVSDRSGQEQIWLWHNGRVSPMTEDASHSEIHNYSWSPDGQRLAWASDDRLGMTDLNGSTKFLDTPRPLFSVLSWFNDQELLVLIKDPQPGGLYLLNLKHNSLSPYGINHVDAAWIHRNNLYYSLIDGEVFMRSIKPSSRPGIALPRLNGKAMVIQGDHIYSVDQSSLMLNQYSLDGMFIKSVVPVKATGWKVSDLRKDQLLLSQFIAIHQEVAILN